MKGVKSNIMFDSTNLQISLLENSRLLLIKKNKVYLHSHPSFQKALNQGKV